MDLELDGHVALVTGASGDLGAACAELLAREGARVCITGRDAARLDSVRERIAALGATVEAIAGDLSDPELVARLTPDGGEPNIFVHAAGHRFRYAKLHAESEDDARAMHEIDEESFARIAKRALPAMMLRRFGRIVAITSLGASVGGAGTPRYSAAKAALEAIVRSIAIDYGRYGITANAVAPGFTATSRFASRLTEDARARLEGATSVKRIAEPIEIAVPVAFLCSPRASYITGVTLHVAGGAQLNNLW